MIANREMTTQSGGLIMIFKNLQRKLDYCVGFLNNNKSISTLFLLFISRFVFVIKNSNAFYILLILFIVLCNRFRKRCCCVMYKQSVAREREREHQKEHSFAVKRNFWMKLC